VIFEPLDFIARLAALIPKPRVNLTRFHGVFAPNSNHRALITPAGRVRERIQCTCAEEVPRLMPAWRSWRAQRLLPVWRQRS